MSLGITPKAVFCVKNSFLESELVSREIPYEIIESKVWLVNRIKELDFNWFVSSGLPIILPISRLKKGNKKQFINIHPSYLPDLKGVDPVPGAILFGRDSGATCHFMDDDIDAGEIIHQIKIPYQPGLTADLLYQLSFEAEKRVFEQSFNKGFGNATTQLSNKEEKYYTFHEDDLMIDFGMDDWQIVRQVRAFNTRSKKARFLIGTEIIKTTDVQLFETDSFEALYSSFQPNEVVLKYADSILVKRQLSYLLFKNLEGDISNICIGENLM